LNFDLLSGLRLPCLLNVALVLARKTGHKAGIAAGWGGFEPQNMIAKIELFPAHA
jgi:hypothetical protein